MGAKSSLPVLEHIALYFLRDFMMPNLDSSTAHLLFIPQLVEAADNQLYEVVADTYPYYAISPIITLFTHDIRSFEDICILFDYILASRNMAVPIYMFTAILFFKKDHILSLDREDPGIIHSELARLVDNLSLDALEDDKSQSKNILDQDENMVDSKEITEKGNNMDVQRNQYGSSFVFEITHLTSSLIENYPIQKLLAWDSLDEYSVLKTTASPPQLLKHEVLDFASIDDSFAEQDKTSSESYRRGNPFGSLTTDSSSSSVASFFGRHGVSITKSFPSPTVSVEDFYAFQCPDSESIENKNDSSNHKNSALDKESYFHHTDFSQITSPTQDDTTFEYLTYNDFKEKKSGRINETRNKAQISTPSSPEPSMSSSSTSLFDVLHNSHSTSVGDSFNQDVLIHKSSTIREAKEESSQKCENEQSESFGYNLDFAREILQKQVDLCLIREEKQKEAEREKKESAKKAESTKTLATNDSLQESSFSMPSFFFRKLIVPFNMPGITRDRMYGSFTRTEKTSIMASLYQNTKVTCSHLFESTRLFGPFQNSTFFISSSESSSKKGLGSKKRSKKEMSPKSSNMLLPYLSYLFYPSNIVSVSIYVGVFGLILSWYFSSYHHYKHFNGRTFSSFFFESGDISSDSTSSSESPRNFIGKSFKSMNSLWNSITSVASDAFIGKNGNFGGASGNLNPNLATPLKPENPLGGAAVATNIQYMWSTLVGRYFQ